MPTVLTVKPDGRSSLGSGGETSNPACLNGERIQNQVGGEGKDKSRREGRGVGSKLLGRGHEGRSEPKETIEMLSHGVEISITGGGAEVFNSRDR